MRLPFRRAKTRGGQASDDIQPTLGASELFLRQPAIAATIQRRPESAPIHRLAAVVMDSHFGQGRRGLAVCGVSVDAGAVGVASNLAAAISMQTGSVLLADLQSVSSTSSGTELGLSNILAEDAVRLQDAVLKDILPGLDLLTSGSDLQADALEGENFSSFAREAMRLYGCTILCGPPANRSSNALTLARTMGHAVIVARASRTFYTDLTQIAADLRKDGVDILGSIMVES